MTPAAANLLDRLIDDCIDAAYLATASVTIQIAAEDEARACITAVITAPTAAALSRACKHLADHATRPHRPMVHPDGTTASVHLHITNDQYDSPDANPSTLH